MQQTSQTPTFNMKAVVRETGIRPDTLRAWERRYNLPDPQRTAGGHRIYSQRDVDTVKWLFARQEEGLSISHAVELFKRLQEEGQDPLLASGYGIPGETVDERSAIRAGNTVQEMRDAWLAACHAFDERAAERILSEAFALFPPEQVCLEVLQKGLATIGQEWYVGATSVQQEHFASALAIRRLEALLAAMPAASRPGKVLIGCPPAEEHTFSPLLLTFLLRRRGWDIVYLGANVPIDKLASTLATVKPRLVAFLAQQLITAATLRDLAEHLQSEEVGLAFGGRIFVGAPSLQERIGGHYLGDQLTEAIAAVERLLARGGPPPIAVPVQPEYVIALEHFEQRRESLQSALSQSLSESGQRSAQFASAAEYLTRNVEAALKLGDLDFVHDELLWIRGLLESRDLSRGLLATYVAAYRRALVMSLDKRAQIVIDWFEALAI